jgi:arylsulfatase A-like enzyme
LSPCLVRTLALITALAIGLLPSMIPADAEATGSAPVMAKPHGKPASPDILMLLLDDAGIDQWRSFTYGGPVPGRMPTLDAIAEAGIKFTNTWSMPSCSTSRATIFTGRFPQRTGVVAATIARTDLANSSVSPYEATLPKVLATAGYRSAMFGKFHMGGPENNPDGHDAPIAQGWDRFYGVQEDVLLTDTTAGGVAPKGTYRWGYVDDLDAAGYGACHYQGGLCERLEGAGSGRTCMEQGGILKPGVACAGEPPSVEDFLRYNGYYAWPRVDAQKGRPPVDDVGRGYHDSDIVDKAIEWIKEQKDASLPWFAVLSTANIHTPYQPPPQNLVPWWGIPEGCGPICADRVTANAMLEGMDAEIGRLLLETGIAQLVEGNLVYDPALSNTMIIAVADNGTWSMIVKPPFDLYRAKGTPYQTGVWVPLFVAGPKVAVALQGSSNAQPVNVADLYRLTAELAGVNVDRLVPRGRIIDARSMIGYLSNPKRHTALNREVNFTEQGVAKKTPETQIYACHITGSGMCTDGVFSVKGLCETNGGEWYGPDRDGAPADFEGYRTCCDLAAAEPTLTFNQQPLYTRAVRRGDFKLVEQTMRNCDSGEPERFLELYRVKNRPVLPVLDREEDDLLANDSSALTPAEQSAFKQLQKDLRDIVSSEVSCPGDGNLDKVVNADDVAGWRRYVDNGYRGSSVFDLNFDAATDEDDLAIIEANLGRDCRPRSAALVQAKGRK